ncbi:MAG: AAA family ATPase [Actinomycetota bacterium]|nr:AAA family ATPase [Actinomycetota bacterium]
MATCPNCSQENPPIAKFCLACAEPLPDRSHALSEERKVVTVLFADLVGFTARAERLDPEDVRAILTPYFARVRSEIEAFGGTVEKFIGDAVMAVFGAPVAHGDDPERAVRAALAMCAAVDEMNGNDAELALKIRIAVNTGEALVSLAASVAQGEGVVAGDVVNTASRLQEAAPVNGILVGEETYRATRSVIRYEDAEPVVAKGKQDPVHVWRALAASAGPGERAAGRVPMLGRASELAVLERTWERVVAERRPQLVTLFGPAGIGKTRLATEFGLLAEAGGARVIKGRSLPYGEVLPYGAFATQVKQVARIFDTDEAEVACRKLDQAVAELLDGEASDASSHIAMLIGVGREGGVGDRQTLFFSARCLVEALANERPTVLVFEDIHWADGGMLDLLEVLASRVRDVPLLLLALARPDLLERRQAWGGGLPGFTALPVEPLSEEHAKDLAAQVLLQMQKPGEQSGGIGLVGEGNPLFIEELAAAVAERAEATAAGEMPTTIRAIVSARLDALPPAERAVLLDAAVVGKVFWTGALERMSSGQFDLAELLDSLEGRDLIRREPVSRLRGDQQFSFKHDLIRDAAYATLPRQQRRKRHAQVAAFLEEATSENPAAASALAQHWREAGQGRRAAEYFVVAGDQAGRGWAKEEAVGLYQQALDLIGDDDPELRRNVTKRQAVAAVAVVHVSDAELMGRRSPQPADS